MIEKLANIMRMQSIAVNNNVVTTRFGVVSSYDPNNYAVKVLFQPDNTESGWLSLGSAWVGNGWGMFSPPKPGTVVKIHFHDGNNEAGVVDTSHFNDGMRPLATPAGEMWLVHSTGSAIKIQNDGSLNIVSHGNTTITAGGNTTVNSTGTLTATAASFTLNGNTTLNGDLQVNGNITDNKDSMENIRTIFNSHVHGGSPGPTPTMPT